MNYPKPYFKNIPNYGDLDLDYIFIELECPLLFTCKDRENNLYLCICCDIRDEQRWIVAPIKPEKLIDFILNRLTFYDFYKNAEKIYKIIWKKTYKSEIVYSSSFSECINDIPPKGEYLDSENGEYSDYIKKLNNLIERDNNFEKNFGFLYNTVLFNFSSKTNNIKWPNIRAYHIGRNKGGYLWETTI